MSIVKEMFVKFIELLHTLDSEKLYSMTQNNWKITNATTPMLSCDPLKLRSEAEILNTGIFVEINRSFNDIVRSIKYLLEEYDIDLDC